ncbi:MAG: hypothetical protein GKS06_00710 [Acidobacteria bacterium]|nr:hypothetical protein [Acidobacteriota bacterium]
MGNVGKYAFIGGVVIAIAMAFVSVPSGALILAVLGLIVGFMNITDDESQGFLLAAIALMLTASSIGGLPEVGAMLASIAANLAGFVAPAALVVALKSLLEKGRD